MVQKLGKALYVNVSYTQENYNHFYLQGLYPMLKSCVRMLAQYALLRLLGKGPCPEELNLQAFYVYEATSTGNTKL